MSSTRSDNSIRNSMLASRDPYVTFAFPIAFHRVEKMILFCRLLVIHWHIVTWTFFCSRAFITDLIEALLKAPSIYEKVAIAFYLPSIDSESSLCRLSSAGLLEVYLKDKEKKNADIIL